MTSHAFLLETLATHLIVARRRAHNPASTNPAGQLGRYHGLALLAETATHCAAGDLDRQVVAATEHPGGEQAGILNLAAWLGNDHGRVNDSTRGPLREEWAQAVREHQTCLDRWDEIAARDPDAWQTFHAADAHLPGQQLHGYTVTPHPAPDTDLEEDTAP